MIGLSLTLFLAQVLIPKDLDLKKKLLTNPVWTQFPDSNCKSRSFVLSRTYTNGNSIRSREGNRTWSWVRKLTEKECIVPMHRSRISHSSRRADTQLFWLSLRRTSTLRRSSTKHNMVQDLQLVYVNWIYAMYWWRFRFGSSWTFKRICTVSIQAFYQYFSEVWILTTLQEPSGQKWQQSICPKDTR